MNGFISRHKTLLIILTLILSCCLQLIWLSQLFSAQQMQLKGELDQLVSKTTQKNWYLTMASFDKPKSYKRIKQVFLAPEWAQLRQAFDNMRKTGLASSMRIESDADSTAITLHLSLKDRLVIKKRGVPVTTVIGYSTSQLHKRDSLTLEVIKKEVAQELKRIGINTTSYYRVYTYNMKTMIYNNLPNGLKPAFASGKYVYGFQDHYRYQLCLGSIEGLIFYRMRYYILSSILMMMLTGAAFYYILRLLRKIQVYAEAKSNFVRNMSHELKTPIATVAVALESIQKYKLENEPEALQSYLNISQYELKRLDHMVEKALNIDQETKGGFPITLELYDVQSGVQQVIKSMRLQLSDPMQITFEASSEPCFVYGDPIHLSNVFYNLIENAIKYTGKHLRLEISCLCDDNSVTLRFKDNGPGIDKLYHEKIFDEFFRVPERGDMHNVKGFGLGLYYVKQVLNRHGGTIRVKSDPGKGTSFIIILKVAS
jgi:signal transduction histidine kinase